MNRASARILVVDDSPSMRRIICDSLTELGFLHLDEAPDGVAALEALQRVEYDVVVTDWNMPRMDGVALLKAIRALPARADTPVLVVTGQVSAQRVRLAVDAGANGFVAKPFIAPTLGEKVLRLVAALPPVLEHEPLLHAAGVHA
ncbi:MAG: response regulator [Myxococcaceae bacterium]